MAVYTVDSAALQARSAAVRSTIDRIRGEVTAMRSNLQSLEGCWTGQAAQLFQGVVVDWQATQQTVEASLENINAALNSAAVGYEDAEQRNTALFRG